MSESSEAARAEESQPPVEPVTAEEMAPESSPDKSEEIGGPKGLEPTRFGDWERAGRCIDF